MCLAPQHLDTKVRAEAMLRSWPDFSDEHYSASTFEEIVNENLVVLIVRVWKER